MEKTMSVLASMGIAIVTALPMVTGPVGEPFEPQILGQRDNGFVVEVVVSCPSRTPGVLHFDKIASEFTDSKNQMHKTAASAYASTCGIDQKFIAMH
jgi:hypothetical protein